MKSLRGDSVDAGAPHGLRNRTCTRDSVQLRCGRPETLKPSSLFLRLALPGMDNWQAAVAVTPGIYSEVPGRELAFKAPCPPGARQISGQT